MEEMARVEKGRGEVGDIVGLRQYSVGGGIAIEEQQVLSLRFRWLYCCERE